MYNAHWIHSLPYSKFIELTLNLGLNDIAIVPCKNRKKPYNNIVTAHLYNDFISCINKGQLIINDLQNRM